MNAVLGAADALLVVAGARLALAGAFL